MLKFLHHFLEVLSRGNVLRSYCGSTSCLRILHCMRFGNARRFPMKLPAFVLVMPGFLAIGTYMIILPNSVRINSRPTSCVLTLVLSKVSVSFCNIDASFHFSFEGLKLTLLLHEFGDSFIKGRFFNPVVQLTPNCLKF